MAATPEMDRRWRKSSASATGECVEVAFVDDGVLVRSSKSPGGSVLQFTRKEWEAFVAGVHRGEFELDRDG